MKKRKASEPLQREVYEMKQQKKINLMPSLSFVFVLKKHHTQWFVHEETLNQPISWIPSEVITSNISKPESFITRTYSETVLEELLKSLLEMNPHDNLYLEESYENKKRQKSHNELELQEKKKIRDDIIYQLVEDKYLVSKIAQDFNIKEKDVYNIHAKKKMEIQTQEKKPNSKCFKVTQEMYDTLENFLSSKINRLSTLKKIRAHLDEKFQLENKHLSLSTISNMLKRLHFSRKRTVKFIERRNLNSTIEKRKEVAIELLSHIKDGREIIYIDETGFNQSSIPFYGYSKVGKKCLAVSSPKSENYTVISAITKGRILGYQVYKGGIKADEFGGFIALMLQKHPEILKDRSKYVFFMDNAPIHRAKSLQPYLKNFRVLFNAPYSPFLNPIEELFGRWKHNFREKSYQNTVNIVEKIMKSVQEIDGATLFSYYIHSLEFLIESLKLHPI